MPSRRRRGEQFSAADVAQITSLKFVIRGLGCREDKQDFMEQHGLKKEEFVNAEGWMNTDEELARMLFKRGVRAEPDPDEKNNDNEPDDEKTEEDEQEPECRPPSDEAMDEAASDGHSATDPDDSVEDEDEKRNEKSRKRKSTPKQKKAANKKKPKKKKKSSAAADAKRKDDADRLGAPVVGASPSDDGFRMSDEDPLKALDDAKFAEGDIRKAVEGHIEDACIV